MRLSTWTPQLQDLAVDRADFMAATRNKQQLVKRGTAAITAAAA